MSMWERLEWRRLVRWSWVAGAVAVVCFVLAAVLPRGSAARDVVLVLLPIVLLVGALLSVLGIAKRSEEPRSSAPVRQWPPWEWPARVWITYGVMVAVIVVLVVLNKLA